MSNEITLAEETIIDTTVVRESFLLGTNYVIDEMDEDLFDYYVEDDAIADYIQVLITPEIGNEECWMSDGQLAFFNKTSGELKVIEHTQPILAKNMDFSLNEEIGRVLLCLEN